MKEHGLLFTTPMIRALLAGTKTQTRRLAKAPKGFAIDAPIGLQVRCVKNHGDEGDAELEYRDISAPHGPVGRVVYAKETWCRAEAWYPAASVAYRADYGDQEWKECEPGVCSRWRTGVRSFDCMACNFTRWVPSIHMPRWASRITLEVTRVRLERVQQITEEDARAEGVDTGPTVGAIYRLPDGRVEARSVYADLWDEINGSGSWASNPWVWVYDFRRVTP